VQQLIGAEANFVAGQPKDARIPRSKHLDLGPTAQPELFELVNMIGIAEDSGDAGEIAGRQEFQGDRSSKRLMCHGCKAGGLRWS
jgi:hypothetical protein